MKKLLGIVVLSLLLSGNVYADYNYKNYLIKKNNDQKYNLLIDNWNKFLKDMNNDNTCNNLPTTKTWLIDHSDCYYRVIKKYMKRNNINHNNDIINAFHDHYEDSFYRAKNLTIKHTTSNVKKSKIKKEINNWFDNWMYQFEDTISYSKNSWINFAKAESSKSKNGKNSKSTVKSGSGFFINNKGYFVTNNHVINGCKQSKITFNEKSVDAKLIAKDETLDLALLRANVKPIDYLNISDDPPEKMQKVFVAGYPFGKGLSDDLKFSQGIISSIKGFGDNSNQIQIDAAINSGNSGGPIVNEDGNLVAVAVSGLDKSKSEGIGFGIKASSVKNFLKVNNAKYSSSSLISFGMSNKKLNKLMEASTVYTFCR